MKLAIAFGSRGRGKALAHYEPGRVVINLTKMKGAGSLAHEWGHAFDDYLGMKVGLRGINTFLSSSVSYRYTRYNNESAEVVQAMKMVVSAMTRINKSVDEIVLELQLTGVNHKRSMAINFDFIYNIIEEDLELITKELDDTRIEGLKAHMVRYKKNLDELIKVDTDTDKIVEYLRKFVNSALKYMTNVNVRRINGALESVDRSMDLLRVVNSNIEECKRTDGQGFARYKISNFYKSAKELDLGRGKPYYSDVVEMFARCFESWVEDELEANGIVSQYLVHSTRNVCYNGMSPYPEGIERKNINKAMRNLVNIAKTVYREDFSNETIGALYRNKSEYVSYRDSIKTVEKSIGKRTSTSKPQSSDEGSQKKPEIANIGDLRQYLIDIAGNNTSRKSTKSETEISNMLEKLSVIGRMKLGYSAIGFNRLKEKKLPLMGNSKAFYDTTLPMGRVIMVETNAKPEKQLEALLEAITTKAILDRYKVDKNEIRMIIEAVTFMLCKNAGLDVRTYCLSRDFEELSKDSRQVKFFINAVKQNYIYVENLIKK